MKVYALKGFVKDSKKSSVEDDHLIEAVRRAEHGLVEATLGRFLIKQRVARVGQGRSKGFRAVIFYRTETIAVFLHMFAKNTQANLSDEELAAFRALAVELDKLNEDHRAELVWSKKWIELDYERDNEDLSIRSVAIGPPGSKGSPHGRRGR